MMMRSRGPRGAARLVPLLGLLLAVVVLVGVAQEPNPPAARPTSLVVPQRPVPAAPRMVGARGIRVTVDFHTAGCMAGWHLRRIGRYADGILTLDRRVE